MKTLAAIGGPRKSALIDASSAILLFKSRWLNAVAAAYALKTAESALRELTVPGYPGAECFQRMAAEGLLEVLPATREMPLPADLAALDPGERECIALFLAGRAGFIIIDDGRGSACCRRRRIPFVNALLMPRLLSPVGRGQAAEVTQAVQEIFRHGHYASWVLDFALQSNPETLASFRP